MEGPQKPIITKKTIENQILQNADQNKFDIGEIERKAIDDTLAEFHKLNPNGVDGENYHHISKMRVWCGRSIENIAKNYPHLKEKVDTIKHDVWNEVVFTFYKNDFKEFSKLIKDKGLEKIDPHTIEVQDRNFYRTIVKIFKNDDGSVDWNFIRKHLSITDEQWSGREKLTLDFFAEKALLKLEELKPETLSPSWIRENLGRPFYRSITNFLDNKKEGDDVKNWEPFLSKLPVEWKDKWKNFHEEKTFDEYVEELIVLLENKKPEKFGPDWIKQNAPGIHEKLESLQRFKKGEIDWEPFKLKLPIKWKQRWNYLEKKYNLSSKYAAKVLIKLTEEDPVGFGPGYVKECLGSKNFLKLKSVLRKDTGKINWESFVANFPLDFQKKWIIGSIGPTFLKKFNVRQDKNEALKERYCLVCDKVLTPEQTDFCGLADANYFESVKNNPQKETIMINLFIKGKKSMLEIPKERMNNIENIKNRLKYPETITHNRGLYIEKTTSKKINEKEKENDQDYSEEMNDNDFYKEDVSINEEFPEIDQPENEDVELPHERYGT